VHRADSLSAAVLGELVHAAGHHKLVLALTLRRRAGAAVAAGPGRQG
jgi:hypothetical protein